MLRTRLVLACALSLPVAACGSVSSFPDGGGSDATSADASQTPDAVVRGTVKVTVIDPTSIAPAVGVQVVFLDPDGTVATRVATDGQGKAQGDVLPGGSVTSVIVTGTTYSMETIQAVKPGDDLVMNYLNTPQDNTLIGTYGVTYPTYPGASTYTLYGPCDPAGPAGTNPLTITMNISAFCKQTTMDLVVVAYDQTGTPLAYNEKPGVAFVANDSTTLANNWLPLKTLNASYTNVPVDVASIALEHQAPDSYGYRLAQNGVPQSGVLALSGTVVTPAAAFIRSTFNSSSGPTQERLARIAGSVLAYNLDVDGQLLKWIQAPTFTPETATLSVTLTGSSTVVPDGSIAQLSYSRPIAFKARPGTATNTYEWIVIRPNAGPLTLPTLPIEVGDVAPRLGDFVGGTFMAMAEADNVAGYDAFRAGLGNFQAMFSDRGGVTVLRTSTSPKLR
jgi:hypothetical protein